MIPISTVSSDGITVGYDDVGTGEPLILIHGHPFDRTMWRPQVDHFARMGWRVITTDLRGYGESTIVRGSVTLDVFARDIANLLDQLEVETAVLTGLSMGGQIVLEFQRLFAHRLRALVLADTSARAETETGKQLRHETADRLLREGMSAFAEEVLPKMITPRNIQDLPAVAEHVLTMMQRTSPEGAAAALRGRADRPDYVEMLADIAVPTLVIVGREDEFTPVAEAELMYELIPDASLAVIDGAAHMPNLERPEAFNEAFQRFLYSLPAAA